MVNYQEMEERVAKRHGWIRKQREGVGKAAIPQQL